MTALGSDRALKVLRDGLVDVVVVMNNRYLTSSTDLVVTPLYEEPIEILMAAEHPLSHYDIVPWEALQAFPQIIFKDGYGMQRLIRDCFIQQQLSLKAAMELNTLDAFRGVIRQGTFIALLPQMALLEARHDSTLAICPIAPLPAVSTTISQVTNLLVRQVVLVTTRDRLKIPPIAHFYNLVKKAEHHPSDLDKEGRHLF